MIQGEPIKDKDFLLDIFMPSEGSVKLYYGRIGSGKTYAATSDILDLLSNGEVVYANWHINYNGFDERLSFWHTLVKFMFFKKLFFRFPKENLHYFNLDNTEPCPGCGKIHKVDITFLALLTDCHVFADEGQWIFDSRSRLDKDWRKLVLHTRHMNRTLNIISQRTQAIEISARGQVNIFYKCEKVADWPWLFFKRSEYQDMKENDVDEAKEPVSVKRYWGRKKVMEAYDTHYLRAGIPRSQEVYFDAFKLGFFQRFRALINNIFGK